MPGGRKPSGQYSNQTAVFSTRMTPELRKQLDRSAKKSRRSLTQEVESRLRKSFEADDIEKVFGDRRNYAFLRLLSLCMVPWGGKPLRPWLDDPYQYHQVEKSVRAILAALRPSGEIREAGMGSMGDKSAAEALGWFTACEALENIRNADPNGLGVASIIKQEMDSLVQRIPDEVKSSETIRRAVGEEAQS